MPLETAITLWAVVSAFACAGYLLAAIFFTVREIFDERGRK
jgi:hypothetical protein